MVGTGSGTYDLIGGGDPGDVPTVQANGSIALVPGTVTAWADYTPTIQDASTHTLTIGNGSLTGRYMTIGKQVTVEKARAQLPLTNNLPHQPRIGHRRADRPGQAVAAIATGGAAETGCRALEAESTAPPVIIRRGQRIKLARDFGNLLGQPQQGDPVSIGMLTNPHTGNVG